jgi:polyisoprenyl-phosphate glycosyltransferase
VDPLRVEQRVAVIVPAKDEEDRIDRVLQAVCGSQLADEIVVVSDGSTDRTAEIAKTYPGVRVLELTDNIGKAGAMLAGVEATGCEIIAFVDADLEGLEADHIDRIIEPLLRNECDMCVGVFRGGKFWSDTAQRIAPYISGQRAMKRWLFLGVPGLRELGMGIEMGITAHVRRTKARVRRVVLHGVSNCHKERKMGLVKGMQARAKMYQEMGQAMVRARKRRARRREWLWF